MDNAHWLSCGAARKWLPARGARAGLMAGPGFPASGGVRRRRASDTGMPGAEETPAHAAGLMPLLCDRQVRRGGTTSARLDGTFLTRG